MTPCVYVSASWDIHDRRWVGALEDTGFAPHVLVLGRDAATLDQLRAEVEALAADARPVLAGPLDTITRHLVGMGANIVGLSWGYDLHHLAAVAELEWLPQLKGLIVDSQATRDIALHHGMRPASITTIPWGVDVHRFTPEGPVASRGDLSLPEGAQFVLSLRAHEPLYRVADIIAAFAAIAADWPETMLVVGHSGSLTKSLGEQAESLGIADRVRFTGSLPESELPALLRAAAVYVTASEIDGTSVTLLQAMACGTPVVASANPGNLDWVHDGSTGDVFPVGDSRALAARLDGALRRGRGPMSEAARSVVVARGDWERNLRRLTEALAVEPR